MQNPLQNHPYIVELLKLDNEFIDRIIFHEKVKPLLLKMASDKDFLRKIIVRNFTDLGYLNQKWSGYNIPFFYVFENEHFNLKIHLFPPEKEKRDNIAAHCIHHHNNYMLTTNAFFGSGYETLLFEKKPIVNPRSLEVEMKVTKHFHQKDINPHTVDSWEPHLVFIPQELSATMLIWTPDKKRTTDSFRQNPLLKLIKKPLRWLIHKLKLTNQLGIAEEFTYQFYPNPNGKGFKGIEESEYFAPTKAQTGSNIDNYSAQMIFAFIQRAELFNKDFFENEKSNIPIYYHPFIEMILKGETIPDVYHRTEINVPQKTYFKEDVLKAAALN